MFWTRKRRDADFSAEIEAHLEIEASRLREEGVPENQARAMARRAFGNLTATKERFHESKHWISIDGIAKDAVYAIRKLKRAPGFSVAAVLLLAVSVGSNIAVFRLIDTVFLRPIGVERPGELVNIGSIDSAGRTGGIFSTILEPLRKEPIFQGVCGFTTPRLTTEINDVVASTGTLAMSGDCFATLGLHAQIGRVFTLSDDSDSSERVAVLTDSSWRRVFGGRTDVIGQKLKVQGTTFTIIGVADRRFTGLLLGFPPGLIIPLQQTPLDFVPGSKHKISFWATIFARRAAGISAENVSARIKVLQKELLAESVPIRYNEAQRKNYLARRLVVQPATTGVDWMLRERYGKPLAAIFGICASVLLVACINLAGLLLVRGLSRQQEIAVRLSLGASRARVGRLLIVESLMPVAAGTLLGLLFATWAIEAVLATAAQIYSNINLNVQLNGETVIFVCGVFSAIAILLSIVPIWQTARFDVAVALKKAGRGIVGAGAGQQVLLSLQIALTLGLVVCSGLFTSSIQHIYKQDLGVDTRGLSESSLSPLAAGYGRLPLAPYYRELLQRIESLPDVRSATIADFAPYWSISPQRSVTTVEGNQSSIEILAWPMLVTDQFASTLGLRLIAGNSFSAEDDKSTEALAIVSEPLAKLLGGERLIGQHIRLGTTPEYQKLKVIGIVSNAQMSLVDPEETQMPAVYLSYWQHPQGYGWLLVKTASGVPMAPNALRGVVQPLGREYVERYSTAAQEKDNALVENRLLAYLSIAFAVLGLALAAVGLFALLSYRVISRTGEIGIRMALGAERSQVRCMILRQILGVVVTGILGGVGVTVLAGPIFRNLVFGIGVYDFKLLATAIAVLVATAILAAWIPAQRAASVDPLTALRQE